MGGCFFAFAKTNESAADTSNRVKSEVSYLQWNVPAIGGKVQDNNQSSRSQPSRFVNHMQQLFGEDPDPLFLEESWTIGVPAAIENLHRRRRQCGAHPGRFDPSGADRAIRELERMACLTTDIGVFLEDRSQPVDRRYAPAWLEYSVSGSNDHPHRPSSSAYSDTPATGQEFRIGAAHARELLGVSQAATREEVRSAYRRKVIECHPDRCQDASARVRRHATRQLADLNEAYRILCEHLLNQAA